MVSSHPSYLWQVGHCSRQCPKRGLTSRELGGPGTVGFQSHRAENSSDEAVVSFGGR